MKLFKIFSVSLVCFLLNVNASGQISPGELSEPHAYLEGMTNCTQCHTLGAKVSNEKCLGCHKELKVRIDQKKGFHSSSKVYKKSCMICHNEHHGRKYDILHFDITTFDHNTTGYKLEGAHAKKECKDCHKTEHITDPLLKKKKTTYLGLKTECLTCHEDYHQKTLSVKCENCHSNEKFTPAPKFNHANSKFILKGQHKTVECKKCHEVKIMNGKNYQQFKGLKFSSCVNCHEDPHHNQFGQNCAECHTEEAFTVLRNTSKFDHSKTTFDLIGKHKTVTCKLCHKGSFTAPVRHARCSDCHKDYHKGQFNSKSIASDCKDCHNENGYTQSSFTIERHNNSNFKLEGAHLATPCIACHKKNTDWSFRDIGLKCNDCHEDIHKTYLDTKYYPEANCLKCHTSEGWAKINFDHNQTAFSLTGKHLGKTCRSCHDKKTEIDNYKLQFTGLKAECVVCHKDEHVGQFEENGKIECSKCHTTEGWVASTFNHDQARFKLDGKHKNIACIQCHPATAGTDKKYILYKTGKIRCENCH